MPRAYSPTEECLYSKYASPDDHDHDHDADDGDGDDVADDDDADDDGEDDDVKCRVLGRALSTTNRDLRKKLRTIIHPFHRRVSIMMKMMMMVVMVKMGRVMVMKIYDMPLAGADILWLPE